jgi:tetratricopeptide (TPR) repeat protein
LKAVLAREPDLGTALFALAECHRLRGKFEEAQPVLLKLLALRPNWRDYQAWHILIETYQKMGNSAEAAAQASKLVQAAPSLEHTCLLARCHDEAGNSGEGCRVLEKALEAYRFTPNPSQADRRWVGKAKQLLNELRR